MFRQPQFQGHEENKEVSNMLSFAPSSPEPPLNIGDESSMSLAIESEEGSCAKHEYELSITKKTILELQEKLIDLTAQQKIDQNTINELERDNEWLKYCKLPFISQTILIFSIFYFRL